MKIGIMQGRLTPPVDNKIQFFPWNNWENEFKLASNKVDLIEWTIDQSNISKNPIFLDNNKILQIAQKHKIKVESVTCDFLMENPFYKDEKQNIQSFYYLEKLIEKSKELEIKYIVFPLVDNGKIINIDEEKKLIRFLEKIEKNIKNLKILFESDYSPIKLKEFIQKFNPDKFGINYDTGNSASLGYEVEVEMNQYFQYIENIHLKDRKLNLESFPLGLGDFCFNKFFKLIKEKGYNGNFIFQTARGENYKELKTLDYNIKFFNKYLGHEIKS